MLKEIWWGFSIRKSGKYLDVWEIMSRFAVKNKICLA